MLGHGLDNQLKEEPGELKPGEVKERSVLFQYLSAKSAPGRKQGRHTRFCSRVLHFLQGLRGINNIFNNYSFKNKAFHFRINRLKSRYEERDKPSGHS